MTVFEDIRVLKELFPHSTGREEYIRHLTNKYSLEEELLSFEGEDLFRGRHPYRRERLLEEEILLDEEFLY